MLGYLKSSWDYITSGCPNIKHKYFNDLLETYDSPKRHYHNLNHIYSLLKLVDKYYTQLQDPKTIQFTIWYHDVIYNVFKKNNEEKSAQLAKEQLAKLNIDKQIISDSYSLILATKKHFLPKELNSSFDAKFLIDIDLSILGADLENYKEYIKQIRQEYSIYPDLLYNNRRKKVLEHFLNSKRIYKTDLFFKLYEKKARKNLAFELHQLS
jgi:predicted metal-dependent HD superfamily phosphohydrolase